jgi:hypothetical protein
MKRYRVIQWSTGNVGRCALQGILNHPQLELVGLWVHSSEKVSRDAGDLCGLNPVGILATNDTEKLLAMEADCVAYTATADTRPQEAMDDLCHILASGKNVVSSSIVALVHPNSVNKNILNIDLLKQACETGGTSCLTSGIDPGFANDYLPLILTAVSKNIETIRVQEILNYSTYNQADTIFGVMGFGQPIDATPPLLYPGALTWTWGGALNVIAEGLGVKIENIKEVVERTSAPDSFDILTGHIEKGTMAALRFEVQGIINGRPAIIIEHVTRLRDDLATDWPKPPMGVGGHRIQIIGSPSITLEMISEGVNGDYNMGGLIITAMRIINSIPAVCEAAPGLLTPLDLPLITGKGLLR